jgi:hypothetical protein
MMTVIGRRRAESSAQWLAQHRRADARLGRGRRRVRDAGERCRVRASRRRAAAQQIALVARTIVPPTVTDDQALYERRALSMSSTRGPRELAFSGRLPLEQGVAFEQAIWHIAKTQRALDKQTGSMLEWQQSPLLVFRPALRIPEIKTCRLVSARVVVRLIWSVQTLDNAAMTANVR